MPTAHVMAGLPASGKTTLARSLWPALRLNADDIRAMLGLTSERWTRDLEKVAVDMMISSAKIALEAGHDIVLDNVHATPNWPKRYRKELGELVDQFVVHDLTDVDADECIERDEERGASGDRSVGEVCHPPPR